MGKFTFKLDDTRALAKLKALQDAGQMQPVFAAIGRSMVNRIRLCFKMGVDPWGSPWAALKFRKGQPLRDTGRLNQSITFNADNTGVTIGTNVKYARTHQYGATIVPKQPGKRLVFPGPGGRLIFAKKVTVPARPFLPLRRGDTLALPPSWQADVSRTLRNYFKKAVA